MRIGIDATPLSVTRAGVGTYTVNLLRALQTMERDEVVPLVNRSVHPSFHEEFSGGELPRPDPGEWWRWNRTLWMQTSLPRRIRRERLDVCHFTNAVAPLSCVSPYVVTIHDAGLWLHPEWHYLRRILSIRPLIPRVVRRAAAVVTVSRSVKEELLGVLGLPEEKVRVVHQGVAELFTRKPSPRTLARVREAYGLPSRFVLSVGAMEPRKNLVRVLEAFQRLTSEPAGRDLGLVIVGPPGWKAGASREALAALPPDAPVLRLGAVSDEDLLALYHLATVLAFPSLYEGFGLPVAEAMSCGTPVVTSRGGALAEVAGDAAELVDPRRVDSIVEGLLRILEDEEHAARLRADGLQRAGRFSWSEAAPRMRAIYEEVSRRPSRRSTGTTAPRVVHPARDWSTPAEDPVGVDLEQACVRAIMYADIFDFPLRPEEVHRYLVGVPGELSRVLDVLDRGEIASTPLARPNGLCSLPGREELVELRRERAAKSQELWPTATRYGRLLARLPFVRMVAVTGSLAAGNAKPGADIDYLVVTAAGRLWLCRAFVILLVRMAARRGVRLCPNYLLSESALELEERNLYTAWELAQMVPVAGIDVYWKMRRENRWTYEYLPNARGLPTPPGGEAETVSETRPGPVSAAFELLLRTPVGHWLEDWERTRKIRRFAASMAADGAGESDGEPVDAGLSADRCKGHFGARAREIMDRYQARVRELERALGPDASMAAEGETVPRSEDPRGPRASVRPPTR